MSYFFRVNPKLEYRNPKQMRMPKLNLEIAVGSQKSTQALGAPGKIQKWLITTKVTTTIFYLTMRTNILRVFIYAQTPF
jgi:hypothetical protein